MNNFAELQLLPMMEYSFKVARVVNIKLGFTD